MGTVKKSAAKPAPLATTKKVVAQDVLSPETVPGGLGSSVKSALSAALKMADIMLAKLRGVSGKKDVAVEQQFLDATLAVHNAEKHLKKSRETLEELLEIHFKAGGTFEHGKFAVTFPVTFSCRPQWKTEAIRLARELAKLQDTEWSEDAFIKTIQEAYPDTPSTGTKITESA